MYGSAFLQKPDIPNNNITITNEDLNGLMSVIHRMNCSLGLSLILHTPGGQTNATETFVSYLRTKFTDIEVIVPAFAMSAGTMISLSADRIIMGRQSQLGPIDPQMQLSNGGSISARAVTEQFDRAQKDVLGNVANAHVWAPIVQSLGPSLLQEAQNALDYSETMVARWLAKAMFKSATDPAAEGNRVAHHFNDATTHKSHGRRIDRDEARGQGVVVDDLEDEQPLQEAVLTVYHLMTLMFGRGETVKVFWSDSGSIWAKNWAGAAP
ncbi:hypothetical protein A9X05_11275 [Mycobacterium sp. E3298]|nr:hypothetical protein A9X05_11275 [Mycobacterium sp. E3298]